MPKIRRQRSKPPPEGWDEIEPTLDELNKKMRAGKKGLPASLTLVAENESHDGKKPHEALWPIFKIHHQRSRYVYELYYKRKAISKELYEYCLKNGYADEKLIAKWKKVSRLLFSRQCF